jgi:hypothetical protein
MATEAATFAGGLAALYAGDFSDPTLPYSIGNPPFTGLLGGILEGLGLLGDVPSGVKITLTRTNAAGTGRPSGLSFTHNQFESDSSATRGDYYQFKYVPLQFRTSLTQSYV